MTEKTESRVTKIFIVLVILLFVILPARSIINYFKFKDVCNQSIKECSSIGVKNNCKWQHIEFTEVEHCLKQ